MSLPLTGRVSIVTGSSRGIGAAIVKRLASQGANVVINYVASAAVAQSIADEINAKGAALGQFGRIDSLVLNAGYLEYALLKDVTEQEYAKHFDTNVKGPLFLTQAAAPHLKPGSKVVLFSTSLTHASTIPPNYLLYAATKGAVEQINRVLAKDLGARGINVNTVAPGPIDTDLFRHGKTEQQIAFFESIHPQKRLGQAEEVSNLVQFLVSDEASWINGQTIRVNGGFAV
ncbi:short chain dehydrogenase/ reductase [Dichomitus squalens LYAD-421 SS1]|uniref:Short chain dehydrogenase/ reductase n=1 Tax=Dichomitus squalens (strain LYAD-421) TaxID=732165 RepID=R7SMP5_DICSQ|nr:short chain dehydrogenase/ reductase [Dichomitus squalens LYAD-421 SS1]EJF56257.1 short chain dehydrogenase/ reductase [Dichomitus squalens LYAD-421 SS1]